MGVDKILTQNGWYNNDSNWHQEQNHIYILILKDFDAKKEKYVFLRPPYLSILCSVGTRKLWGDSEIMD